MRAVVSHVFGLSLWSCRAFDTRRRGRGFSAFINIYLITGGRKITEESIKRYQLIFIVNWPKSILLNVNNKNIVRPYTLCVPQQHAPHKPSPHFCYDFFFPNYSQTPYCCQFCFCVELSYQHNSPNKSALPPDVENLIKWVPERQDNGCSSWRDPNSRRGMV